LDSVLDWRLGKGTVDSNISVFGNDYYQNVIVQPLMWNLQNLDPSVDPRRLMDEMMYRFANDKRFFGLGGVSFWHTTSADPAIVKWASTLFRHYCIRGNTNKLSDEANENFSLAYAPGHVTNPNFDGATGWTITPGDVGKAGTDSYVQLTELQRKYPGGHTLCDGYCWFERTAVAENTAEQTLTGLTNGRLYQLTWLTGDVEDLDGDTSSEKTIVGRYTLTNATELSNSQDTFNSGSNEVGGFNAGNPYWMNWRTVVFRATSTTSDLMIGDYESAGVPGGDIGDTTWIGYVRLFPHSFGVLR
jgi:hypothetical protein